jgi:serine protease Do
MARTSLVFLLTGALALQSLAQPGGTNSAAANHPDFRRIVSEAKDKVWPAVVYIKCLRESNDAGKKETQEVSGSGVIISAEGEIITNWHVIDKATSVRCLLSDGRHAEARIVGSDKDTDLAVIRLNIEKDGKEWKSLPYAAIGDSSALREGDFVMTMGAPWGLNRSVAIGIISCTSRYLDGISQYSLWLQTDAAINPGNSGGPLVNTAGEVVGLNTRGSAGSADGLGFAIPSTTIQVLVPQIREFGRVNWSWTGLQLQPLRDFNRDIYFDSSDGVIVSETDPDSPARRAGIQPRDRIVKVNGRGLTAGTSEDLPAVQRTIGLLAKDKEAEFTIVRGDGSPQVVKLTPREKGKVEGEELALDRFDMTVKAINQFDNPDLYFQRQKGVFVFAVKYPGNAGNAGLVSRDIILKIDGKDVSTVDDVKTIHKELLANVDSKSRVVVTLLRAGLLQQKVLDFARDYQRE